MKPSARTLVLLTLLVLPIAAGLGMDLRQSTDATIKIGPFLDGTDGVTAETGLTIAQADVRLSKNGGDMAQKTDSNSCAHDELGYYNCLLDETDTGTLGRLKVMISASGAMPVWHDFMVLDPNIWDSRYATGEVDVYSVRGTAPISQANVEAYSQTGAQAAINASFIFDSNSYVEVRIMADGNDVVFDPNTTPVTTNSTSIAAIAAAVPSSSFDPNDVVPASPPTGSYGWFIRRILRGWTSN